MPLRDLCRRLGGILKEKENEEVCRIPIEGSYLDKRRKIFEIFGEIGKLAEELGLENIGVGGVLKLSKRGYTMTATATLSVQDFVDSIKAIEIEYDAKNGTYSVTPIAKGGRGCTLVFGRDHVGGYCTKSSWLDVEVW